MDLVPSFILSNSSIQQIPLSLSTSAPLYEKIKEPYKLNDALTETNCSYTITLYNIPNYNNNNNTIFN